MDWGQLTQGALETGANALTGGIASGIGSFFSGLFGGDSEKANRKFQQQMLEKQLNFQSEQAQLNREFQSGEADKMRDYNSIASQMQRAQAAGVNPWSLVSSGGQVGTAQTSLPSGSMPSGSASFPAPVQANQLVRAQSFNAVADAINAAANARRAGLESDRYNELIDKQLAKMDTEIKSEELRQVWQGFANKKFDKTFQYQVSQEFEKWQLLLEQTTLTRNQANKALAEFRGVISKAKLNEKQYEYMEVLVNNLQDMIDSKLAVQASETTRNYAQATESTSRAALADAQAASQRLDTLIRNSTAISEMRANNHSFDVVIKTSDDQIKTMYAQAQKLIAEGKYAEAQQIVGMINHSINSLSGLINSFKPGVSNSTSNYGETTEYTYGDDGKVRSVHRRGGSNTNKR